MKIENTPAPSNQASHYTCDVEFRAMEKLTGELAVDGPEMGGSALAAARDDVVDATQWRCLAGSKCPYGHPQDWVMAQWGTLQSLASDSGAALLHGGEPAFFAVLDPEELSFIARMATLVGEHALIRSPLNLPSGRRRTCPCDRLDRCQLRNASRSLSVRPLPTCRMSA